MTETTTIEPPSTPDTPPDLDRHASRRLLDDCPRGPWPLAAYAALDELDRLRMRQAWLTAERDAARAATTAAEEAEAVAIVDGEDTAAHAAEATEHRETARRLDRALATLAVRLHDTSLDVIRAQEAELTDRAHTAHRAALDHAASRQRRIKDLAAFDGDHWLGIDSAAEGYPRPCA